MNDKELKAQIDQLRKELEPELQRQIGMHRAWARSFHNAKELAVEKTERLEKSLAERDAEIERLKGEIAELKASEWYRMAEQYKNQIMRPK